MASFFDQMDFPFFTPRKPKRLNKYAILLNEPKVDEHEEKMNHPCSLAAELLPDLLDQPQEDMVEIIGQLLLSQIKSHAEVDKVPIFKPDDIIQNNAPTLVPVMYRIATEHFAQKNDSKFKIIECRNATKLISDWKPSLPDKLISLGHQVIVVQLETSFVPYTDFAYAILRQLNCDWKNRLPRSFFFPDDVCKVEATPERDLCVVSPSMPDGDLEINKKMGLLNYEILMMIKSSCMSAMKNYLLKRDLRVGKFSDTLDGVSALRQLYRKLQERLNTGERVELGCNSLEDLRSLVKQSIGGTDVLAAQTWIEYGKTIGLEIPASASSSATSISSARRIMQGDSSDSDDDGSGRDDKDDIEKKDNGSTYQNTCVMGTTAATSSSPSHDANDGKACLEKDEGRLNGNSRERKCSNDDANNAHYLFTTANKSKDGSAITVNSEEDEQEDEGLKLEDFTEFRDSLIKMHKTRKVAGCEDDEREDEQEDQGDDDEFPTQEFSADSILKILQLPNRVLYK